ncbi:MAP7 domain-containing protein 2 isoform X6 [Anarrhichthys ocellatus]|uniref:MAP7 domain-containing protein 2 isoform X6 n=1 Tax=Anarrhichthys ocellatus TaxID=433405 RepID=UPI0012ED9B80|nr:MAP7 domain-containing protein 2-like isoform X6 [Anarrhichthys ocellatus]
MAEGATTLKGLRAQMAAAAQVQAEERRSLSGNSPGPTTNAPAKPQGSRPVIDGAALRIDDRLRVAKERREEAERQQVLKDSQVMERERKAKMQVERQVEERQKKVDDQRRKEEQKRLAVEEKRKQKQEEEKEHYEAMMRRTLERSQRVEQRQKRWSWGGLATDSDGRTGDSDAGTSSPVTIVVSPASPEKPLKSRQVDKRSTSTMNLKQPSEAGISKRLSTSSATLIKSPDKQCHLCPRSASATPLVLPRGPVRSRSIDRQKSGMTTSVSADGALDPSMKDKQFTSPGGQRPSSPSSTLGRNRSPSPAPNPAPKRTPSPAPNPAPKRTPSPTVPKQSSRTRPPSPGAMKQRPPSPQPTSAKPPPIQKPALTPTGPPTLRKRDSKSKDLCPVQAMSPQSSDSNKTKEKDDPKASTGSNTAAEAAKILAENRRLMREQKEREELLRVQREEEEKLRKEEEMRLAEEARLKRLVEEEKLAEERKIKDEEDALLAEEERVRMAEEEAVKQAELQKEREEAEAKALEEAERVRVERERVMQQNQQERMERKKRIEEIMKRTRKGDQCDMKGDAGDDDKQEEGEEGEEGEDCETQSQSDDIAEEDDKDESGLSSGEPEAQREEPLGSVNGKPEMDDKENNNGISTAETQAGSPVPKSRLVEGSEFLNEQDSAKVDLVSGLNGKSNQWSFEELIDLNVHSKALPLIKAEDCNQVLINCDGSSDGTRVAFEDKGTPVNTLHSSSQPIEALSEI